MDADINNDMREFVSRMKTEPNRMNSAMIGALHAYIPTKYFWERFIQRGLNNRNYVLAKRLIGYFYSEKKPAEN